MAAAGRNPPTTETVRNIPQQTNCQNPEVPSARIGFVLLSHSSDPQPSTRVSVLNMLPFLRDAGFETRILHEPQAETETPDVGALDARELARRFDIVYFQKVHGPSVVRLVNELSALGVRTVYGMCDLVEPTMADATDATIVVTDYLKSLHPPALQPKIHVVHDGIENPAAHKTRVEDHRGSRGRPLRAVLVASASLAALPVIGTPPPWLQVSIVGRYPQRGEHRRRLRQIRWEFERRHNGQRLAYLSFLFDRRIERIAWDPVGVYQQMLRADIGIIPVDTGSGEGEFPPPAWKVKSENRLTLKMALGLPVVATPIPSYEPVVVPGENAFFARDRGEWLDHLEALRDPALREAVGRRARASVLHPYSKEVQAQGLIEVLRPLLR